MVLNHALRVQVIACVSLDFVGHIVHYDVCFSFGYNSLRASEIFLTDAEPQMVMLGYRDLWAYLSVSSLLSYAVGFLTCSTDHGHLFVFCHS